MPLIKFTELLKDSQNNNYITGIFECWNYESALAEINAAEKRNVPMVLFAGDPAVRLLGIKNLAKFMLSLAGDAKIPVACHIESVNDYKILFEAIKYGFPSVIYDASEMPLEQNIENTRKVVEFAHNLGAEVEAQIGSMPFAATGLGYEKIKFEEHKTKIEEAERFASATKIDVLAPNLGNVHGLFKQKVKEVDIDLANRLVEKTGLPVTLHGGTGIPDEIIKEAKKSKIGGMYFATCLFENFKFSVKQNIDKYSGYGAFAEVLINCRKNLEEYVEEKINLIN